MDEPASFDSIGNLTVRFDLLIKGGRDGERKRKRWSQLQTSVVNMGMVPSAHGNISSERGFASWK